MHYLGRSKAPSFDHSVDLVSTPMRMRRRILTSSRSWQRWFPPAAKLCKAPKMGWCNLRYNYFLSFSQRSLRCVEVKCDVVSSLSKPLSLIVNHPRLLAWIAPAAVETDKWDMDAFGCAFPAGKSWPFTGELWSFRVPSPLKEAALFWVNNHIWQYMNSIGFEWSVNMMYISRKQRKIFITRPGGLHAWSHQSQRTVAMGRFNSWAQGQLEKTELPKAAVLKSEGKHWPENPRKLFHVHRYFTSWLD